jgi:hypothetical protein
MDRKQRLFAAEHAHHQPQFSFSLEKKQVGRHYRTDKKKHVFIIYRTKKNAASSQ